MSKMGNIAMELDERAVELGFADHLEAMANGYDWGVGEDGVAFLFKVEDEQEKAHEAWLEEKQQVLNDLDIVAHSDAVPFEHKEIVKQAYEFIREQCHD